MTVRLEIGRQFSLINTDIFFCVFSDRLLDPRRFHSILGVVHQLYPHHWIIYFKFFIYFFLSLVVNNLVIIFEIVLISSSKEANLIIVLVA